METFLSTILYLFLVLSFLFFFFYFSREYPHTHTHTGERSTKIYTRRGSKNICKISKAFGSSLFAGTTGSIRERENPPWKYEPRISITKSFVFVATEVNDTNPPPTTPTRIECKPVLMHICSTLLFHNPTDLIYYHQRRRPPPRRRRRQRRTTSKNVGGSRPWVNRPMFPRNCLPIIFKNDADYAAFRAV